MTAYYNEIDPFAAQWLRELIKQGHLAPGIVDERSIEDVRPDELAKYTQCHFFAGIGVWSHSLRSAGWPDDRPVWTGSCPCQPFSSAGKGGGFADKRHLWPAFHWLIDQCRPDIVFGEQVAGRDGLTWLDLVSNDLEGSGYACGAAVTAACGFGAPHQRKRLYWVAQPDSQRRKKFDPLLRQGGERGRQQEDMPQAAGGCQVGELANAQLQQRSEPARASDDANGWYKEPAAIAGLCSGSELANASGQGLPACECRELPAADGDHQGRAVEQRCISLAEREPLPGPTNGFWKSADWLHCRDGKWRPVEPGSFPLVDGAPARVGRLRGYGNAIVAQQAQGFIKAVIGV